MSTRSGFGKRKTDPIETNEPTDKTINANDIIVSANNNIQSNKNIEGMLTQIILTQYKNDLIHTKKEWVLMHQICVLKNEETSSCAHIKSYIECLELKGLGECEIDLSN
jgi:hypothetical protein